MRPVDVVTRAILLPRPGNASAAVAGNNLRRLLREHLQAELQLSDEQQTQIQDLSESRQIDRSLLQEEQREALRKETLAKLQEFLEEEQFAWAKQILLHAREGEDLTQEDVAPELELSEDQREKIAGLIEAYRKKNGRPSSSRFAMGKSNAAKWEKR